MTDDILTTDNFLDDDGSQNFGDDNNYNSKPSYLNDNRPKEIFSRVIKAKKRTFFIDLKESKNGMFLKISEKSRGGQKTTIMMDQEDVGEFSEAIRDVLAVIKGEVKPEDIKPPEQAEDTPEIIQE